MLIAELLTNAISAGLLVFFIEQFGIRRFSKNTNLITASVLTLCYFLLLTWINYFSVFEGYWGAAVYFIVSMTFSLVLLKDKKVLSFTLGVTWVCSTLLSALLSASLIQIISGEKFLHIIAFGNPIKLIGLFVNCLVKFAMVFLTIKMRREVDLNGKDAIVYCVLLLLITITAMSVFQIENSSELSGNGIRVFILAFALILLILTAFYYLIRISRLMKAEAEFRLITATGAQQAKSLKMYMESIRELRQAQHDSAKAIATANEMLKSGKVHETALFLKQYKDLQQRHISVVSTGETIVDAVLNLRQSHMKDEMIDFSCSVQTHIPDDLVYASGIILANLMDNAIEAELKNDNQREIRLKIYQKGAYLCIRTENYITDSVIASNPGLTTTKEEKEWHGFGIQSIDYYCKENGGFHNIYEDNNYFAMKRVCA